MIHPSYSDLMAVINSEVEGDQKVVESRYSVVIATAKRARQLVAGEDTPLVPNAEGRKPLSIAVDELYHGLVKIVGADS